MEKKNNYIKKFTFNDQVCERITYLKKVKDYLEKQLKCMPAGTLLIAPGTTPNSFRYYRRESSTDKNGTYLDKSKQEIKKQLAGKKYYEKLHTAVSKELTILEKMNKLNHTDAIIHTYESLNDGLKKLIHPINVDDDTYATMWEAVTYEGLEFAAEDKTEFYTKRGERVRSKSELLIANTLYDNNIPYRYEYPLEQDNGRKLYPDFMVLNRKQRKEFYWEHLGMMDNPDYVGHNIWKFNEYRKAGVVLGANLFVTYETASMPLGTGEIKRLIHLFL